MPPIKNKPLKLYISAAEGSIGGLLAQDNAQGKEHLVYYLSRLLTLCERRYTPIEKICLALYFSAIKLRHYILPVLVYIISKTDPVKYLLSRPIMRGRIGKWSLALMEFSFQYIPQKAVKGQALADFLTDHPCVDIGDKSEVGLSALEISPTPWTLLFDGSRTQEVSGCGVIIISPQGLRIELSFQIDFSCTNNQAEYELVVIGLKILRNLEARDVRVIGDSNLVINHLAGTFKCYSEDLASYYMAAVQLMQDFDNVTVKHVSRSMNTEANSLAQALTCLKLSPRTIPKIVTVQKRLLPSVRRRGLGLEVFTSDFTEEESDDEPENDWRTPIISFLKRPHYRVSRKIRRRAINYILMGYELYKKSPEDDLLFRCLGCLEAMRVMSEVHEGICGVHQSGIKMR